uniref:T-lymphocyte activation antigen CD86 isoform X2 n=1 Tax=Jaculus jaculus TaxID=51337 RepID=UPI001E1B071A|nr:T-lymphocyte activation antigen CD86 isoform X2 [Jaculus jaculus]
MDPRGTMVLRLLVCVTVVLVSDAASQKSEAYFNRTAFLPCQFVNSQNKSLAELVLFWQDQETLVLYELYLGKEKLDNVNAKYLGRTSFDQKSWTLQLHNVRIQDKGLYQCYIHHKGPTGLILLHKMSSELSVLANFSEPEIVPVSNISRNSGINLTCLSRQGYPKPKKMYFALKSQNSTIHYSSNMQISEDNVTKLYSVSVHLSVPFPSGAGNVTIFCVLELEPKKTQLLSLPFFADPKDPIPVKKDQRFWIAIAFSIVIAVIAVIAIHKRRKKQRPDISHKGETTKAEKEESEQVEESPGYATLLKEV